MTGPLEPPPAPDPLSWSPALLAACQQASGEPGHRYAGEPALLDTAHGLWAFGFRLSPDGDLAPDAPDADSETGPDAPNTAADATTHADAEGWTVPLMARIGHVRADLEREAAAMELARAHGCGAMPVLGVLALGTDVDPEPLHALVSHVPRGVGLPELIGFNLHHSEALLKGFAANQQALNAIAPDGSAAIPTVDPAAELARVDADRFPDERRWLEENLAPTERDGRDLRLCHGGYQPLVVFGPPAAEWPQYGGPGKGLRVSNWAGAVLAEPEYDVAFTLVAFWSAPFFAPNRAERTAIKMIRNTLINTYTRGYTGYHELDAERLRWWRAFHTLRGMARLASAYDGKGSVFEGQDRGPLPDDLFPELERHFLQLARMR